MMHEDEIRDISAAMAQLGAIRSEVVERLCTDFVEILVLRQPGRQFREYRDPAEQGAAA